MSTSHLHQPQPSVVLTGLEAQARLGTLGLSLDGLLSVVRQGEVARQSCGEYDPPALKGMLTWGRTTGLLREWLVPLGWVPDDRENYARTVSPDGAHSIVTASGDAAVGQAEYTPRTSRSKGPLTAEAVRTNKQLVLFGDLPVIENTAETWILLVGHDGHGVARAELSRPSEITQTGWIVGWDTRIVLGEVGPADPQGKSPAKDLDPDRPTPDGPAAIDVPVTRRK